jgi:hypothetical protein
MFSKNGDDHRPHVVHLMMQQLWAEYVEANPDAFKWQNARPLLNVHPLQGGEPNDLFSKIRGN